MSTTTPSDLPSSAGKRHSLSVQVFKDISGTQSNIGYIVEIEDGVPRAILDIDQRHINRNGGLHGGIMAMLLDAVSGYAASFMEDGKTEHPVATITMTVNYLAPVSTGRVIATATVTGGGRHIAFVDAELNHEDGVRVATSTGTFRLLKQ